MPFYLDNYRVFSMAVGFAVFPGSAIVVRDLSYLEPSKGALCVTAVIDTGLRRSVVSYL